MNKKISEAVKEFEKLSQDIFDHCDVPEDCCVHGGDWVKDWLKQSLEELLKELNKKEIYEKK